MKKQNFKKNITTERLILKPVKPSLKLAKALYQEIERDSHYISFLPFCSIKSVEEEYCLLLEQKSAFNAGKSYTYMIFDKQNNILIGMISLHNVITNNEEAEIIVWVHKKYSGDGYAVESIKALEQYFFDVGGDKIYARVNVNNKRSIKMVKKLGYKKNSLKFEQNFKQIMLGWGQYNIFSKTKTFGIKNIK